MPASRSSRRRSLRTLEEMSPHLRLEFADGGAGPIVSPRTRRLQGSDLKTFVVDMSNVVANVFTLSLISQ